MQVGIQAPPPPQGPEPHINPPKNPKMAFYKDWARLGWAQWSETHINPPKNPKNHATVLQYSSIERLFCPELVFNNFKH